MKRTFLALLFSVAITAAIAAEPPETSFVYYDNVAVVRLLKRMDLLLKARGSLAQPPATVDPNLQEIMRYMARRASDEELYRAIAPTYSRYISINDANKMSKGAADPKAYAALTKQLQDGEPDYLAEWARAYFMQRLSQEAKRDFEAVREAKPGSMPPALEFQRTGVAALDAPLMLSAEARRESMKLGLAAKADNDALALEDPLNPARLVTAAGIAQSRAEVRQAENRMENFFSAVTRLQSDFPRRMGAVLTDHKLHAVFERAWVAEQHHDLDFLEQERAAIGQLLRLLDFVESRLGKIHWDGEELSFDDDDDIDSYNAMLDKLQAQNPRN